MAITKVTNSLVATNAIQGTLIADNAITSVHIAQNQVTAVQIPDGSITSTQIAANSIDTAELVTGSIDTIHIGNDQVTTAKIADLNVTTGKIANNAITSAKIPDGSITETQLSSSATPTFGNITTTGSLRGPASFTIDPAAVGDNTGTVVIAGSLQVDGTTTTVNSTTLSVADKNIVIASGAADAAAANDAGLTVTGASATLLYKSSGDKWSFNKPLDITGNSTATNQIATTSVYSNNGVYYGASTLDLKDSSSASFLSFASNKNATFAGNISAAASASNSVPRYTFTGDTDTGLGYISANSIGLIAGGSRKFYINSTTAYFQNLSTGVVIDGNLHAGDGTDISMDSSANGQIEADGNGYQGAIALDGAAMHVYHNSASRNLVFGTNETARLTFGGSGGADFHSNNLTSVGTISSGAITSSGSVNATEVRVGNLVNNGTISANAVSGKQALTAKVANNGNSLFQGFNASDALITQITGTGALTHNGTISSGAITSSGNLLVNGIAAINKTAVASAVALTINSDASTTSSYGLEVCNATSNTRFLVDGVGNTTFYGSNNAVTARFTSDNLFRIGASGGTGQRLSINGHAQSDTMSEANAWLVAQANGGDGIAIGTKQTSPYATWIQSGYLDTLGTSNHYALALNPHGGNVGIGDSNPSATLDVVSTAQNVLDLETTNSDGPLLTFINNGAVRGYIGNAEGAMGQGTANLAIRAQGELVFGTNGNNERMRIASNGKVTLHGNAVDWNETTQGQATGTLHLDPGTNDDNKGSAITWGASDHSNGSVADAGIYVRSDGAYGTKMYISTTDSYASGSKTSIKIDQAGRVTMPRQPAFQAYLSSGQSITTTETTVAFNTENFDTGGNHANGVFTAPVAGVYNFGVNILLYPFTTGVVNARFYTNSSAGTVVQHGASNNSHTGLTMTANIVCAAGDEITFRISGSSLTSTNVYGGQAYWHGHLVG